MSLTTAEVGRVLDVPEATVRQWAHRGKLPPIRRGTRPLLFDEATVEAFQAQRWRAEQRAASRWIRPVVAEYERLVAAQVSAVSRSAQESCP
jgi:excisionase family DNA binding protein